MTVAFFGNTDYSVEMLKKIIALGYEVPYVCTTQDQVVKVRGKEKTITQPVSKFARDLGLNLTHDIYEPVADVFVVVAFKILPPEVYEKPGKGCINIHPSLLPDYRGAAPIEWAIMNGDTYSGVTSFIVGKNLDSGDILDQRLVSLDPEKTKEELMPEFIFQGQGCLWKTLRDLEYGWEIKRPQVGIPKKAPKIGRILLQEDEDPKKIYNYTRALGESEKLEMVLHGVQCKIIRGELGDGKFYPLIVKPQGKRRMYYKDFLNGRK